MEIVISHAQESLQGFHQVTRLQEGMTCYYVHMLSREGVVSEHGELYTKN